MNFSVTCSDSGRTQRASGAKPCTPSRKRAMRARISGSRSMPMNIRIFASLNNSALQQRPADHLQRLLGCELANALAIAGEITFDDLRAFFSRERDVDQAYRLLLGSAARAGDSG